MRKRTARQRALSLPGVSQVSQVLHAGVIYRHIILTVPAMFRTTFYHNAAVLLSPFIPSRPRPTRLLMMMFGFKLRT